jgi:ATP-dependent DNA helicase RecG
VEQILEKDPKLEHPDNQKMRDFYLQQYKGKNKWGKIS